MRRCLVLISLLLLVTCIVAQEGSEWSAESGASMDGDLEAKTLQYGMLMTARGQEVTGVCVMEMSDDGSLVGSVVNEFGVKAFDFMFNKGKTKVLNVIKPLNKWYIRRVLRCDLNHIIPEIIGRNQQEGEQVYRLGSRSYVFTPIGDNPLLSPIIQ